MGARHLCASVTARERGAAWCGCYWERQCQPNPTQPAVRWAYGLARGRQALRVVRAGARTCPEGVAMRPARRCVYCVSSSFDRPGHAYVVRLRLAGHLRTEAHHRKKIKGERERELSSCKSQLSRRFQTKVVEGTDRDRVRCRCVRACARVRDQAARQKSGETLSGRHLCARAAVAAR